MPDRKMAQHEGEPPSVETELFDNLKDTDANNPSGAIFKLAMEGHRIWFFGEAGAGKTTLLGQLSYKLRQRKPGVKIRHIYYDDVLSRTERQLARTNPELADRNNWHREQWLIVNMNMLEELKKVPRRPQLVEAPGVGASMGYRDRARLALKTLAETEKAQGSKKSVFVYVIADPLVQRRAALIRQDILDARAKDVMAILKANNINLVGFSDNEEDGEKVKMIMKRSANKGFIEMIDREMLAESFSWLRTQGDQESALAQIKIPSGKRVAIDYEFADLYRRADIDKIRIKAAYAHHFLGREIGLSENQAFVVFNEYRQDSTISSFINYA